MHNTKIVYFKFKATLNLGEIANMETVLANIALKCTRQSQNYQKQAPINSKIINYKCL